MENQVGLVRERFFAPRLRYRTYEEMNGWLIDQCVAYAKAHPHPECRDQTIWSVFEAERPGLVRTYYTCWQRSRGGRAMNRVASEQAINVLVEACDSAPWQSRTPA